MSQGQVPRVLRKGAKIVAATKSPPPDFSLPLTWGRGGAGRPVARVALWHGASWWAALLTAPAWSLL